MRTTHRGMLPLTLALAVVSGACTGGPAATGETRPPSPSPTAEGSTSSFSCGAFEGEPWISDGPVATPVVLSEGGDGTPRVEAVVYPHPDYEARLWSQWGQGVVLPDGRFFSGIGDHGGADGNSFVYEYDPAANRLAMIADVLALTDHQPGAWGYGKIHAQMIPGPCGEVYFATYWGTSEGLTFGSSYGGDRLFRLDPAGRTVADLGVPVPERGIPSLAGWMEEGLLYGEAADPLSKGDRYQGAFFVYDVRRNEVVFRDDDPAHAGFRNIAVDARGRAHYSLGEEGSLAVYDPGADSVRPHAERIPGDVLRASAPPAPDGTVYGVTRDPPVLFVLEPSGRIRTLGPISDYTTSLALDPDGSRLLYVPGAHGAAWRQGTPLMSVDTRTGESSVVVELNELAEEALGLRLGGTYNVAIDAERDVVYIGMNAAPPDQEKPFGEVVLVIVHLP